MPDSEKVVAAALTPEQVKERTQSGNLPMMYFNYVRVASSYYDMRLFFGQGNISPKGEHSFQEELCVAMSMEFAKQLRDFITAQLEHYEKNFGPLRQLPSPPAASHAANGSAKKKRTTAQ